MNERANVSATPAGSGKQSTFTYNWAEAELFALDEYTQFQDLAGWDSKLSSTVINQFNLSNFMVALTDSPQKEYSGCQVSFPWVKRPDVALTTHPYLAPTLKKV
jgi:hypothetical protein